MVGVSDLPKNADTACLSDKVDYFRADVLGERNNAGKPSGKVIIDERYPNRAEDLSDGISFNRQEIF